MLLCIVSDFLLLKFNASYEIYSTIHSFKTVEFFCIMPFSDFAIAAGANGWILNLNLIHSQFLYKCGYIIGELILKIKGTTG